MVRRELAIAEATIGLDSLGERIGGHRRLQPHFRSAGEVAEMAKDNCIIPTNQNHNNIQKDMEAKVPDMLERPTDEVRHMLEMLVRAYDPCISCSTH